MALVFPKRYLSPKQLSISQVAFLPPLRCEPLQLDCVLLFMDTNLPGKNVACDGARLSKVKKSVVVLD